MLNGEAHTPRKPGRPKERGACKPLNVRMISSLKTRLKTNAALEGKTETQLIEEALEMHLKWLEVKRISALQKPDFDVLN